jgi:haloalkane dehalogenase
LPAPLAGIWSVEAVHYHSADGPMTIPQFLRTPDDNFAGLADFPFAPHYLDVDGLRMHYVDEGPADGPVALMVHGMPTWSYLYRSVIATMLQAGYRCVAPDHIGFGRSDKVTDPSWYTIARHTANLTALVEALNLRDVTLFVQDWGGPTGLAQVVTMPARFSRLVIMNTWLHHDGYEYTPAIRSWIAQNEPGGLFRENVPDRFGWGTLLVVGTRRADPREALFPALQGYQPVLAPDVDAVRAAYDAPFAGLGEAGIAGPRQFPLCIPVHDHARGDGDAQASHFRGVNATALPVHFVWGGADDVFPTEWGRRWHELIPHSTWDDLPDASHFLQDTHGEEITRIVLGHAG